ncbi:MAG: type I glyceraldehyde-3-phosphate dehydrogenase, partial [Planctomycetota bacterium]|nr:type I glyceraldehyde-3-phosphate dehydrogenase [Planctomycetota bacterium]
EISVEDGGLRIDDRAASYSEHPEPGDIPWADLGVDIVLECSGQWRTIDTLTPHLDAGARRVIVAAPVKGGVPNIVMGCNEDSYDPAIDRILTAASCTTNCLAPVVKVIHESFGIEHGVITTIHDATNTQVVVDSPHRDLRRARSALNALIPTSTGSATAITMIYPELKGRLDGIAIRVPLLNASLLDAVFTVKKSVTVVEVNDALRVASEGSLEGILGFETRPLVSTDFVNDPRSGIIDAPSTMVIGDRMVKILAWYDNEYGYACRLVDLASRLATQLRILLG